VPKRNQIDEAVINLQREIEIRQAAIEVLFAIKKSKKAAAFLAAGERAGRRGRRKAIAAVAEGKA